MKWPRDLNTKCTLLLMLNHQPLQYKLRPGLAGLLGVRTQMRAAVVQAPWLYITYSQLRDRLEHEDISFNRYFR